MAESVKHNEKVEEEIDEDDDNIGFISDGIFMWQII